MQKKGVSFNFWKLPVSIKYSFIFKKIVNLHTALMYYFYQPG